MKTVGAVMATYNGEKFLSEQLDSIIHQTKRLQQIVIVDDKSRDRTREIIRKYLDRFPELIDFKENSENLGAKKTFEKGLMLCDTDYIALCDQDDVWRPEKIEKMVKCLLENETAKLCFHDLEIINQDGLLRAKSYWAKAPENEPLPVSGSAARDRIANFSNPVPGCTMVFDSSLKEHILPMPSSAVGHDWWISAVAFYFAEPVFIAEPLGQYRFHPNQTAGIGTTLIKKKNERKILPTHSRIVREVKRIVFSKRSKKEKEMALKVGRYAVSAELLKIIEKYRETFLRSDRDDEYRITADRMRKNLIVYGE